MVICLSGKSPVETFSHIFSTVHMSVDKALKTTNYKLRQLKIFQKLTPTSSWITEEQVKLSGHKGSKQILNRISRISRNSSRKHSGLQKSLL